MNPSLNNPVKCIILHHTAVSYSLNSDQWEQTNEYHRQRFNFKSSLGFYAGYTYEISFDGVVRQSRALGEETAAVLGQNKNSVSICLDGNFDIEMPTKAQVVALKKLLGELLMKFKLTAQVIYPHRKFCGMPPYKSCCGNLLPNNWGTLVALYDEAKLSLLIASPLGGALKPRLEAE